MDDEDKPNPRLLTIGDSFYWSLEETGLTKQVFSEPEFIYYFQEIYPTPADPEAIRQFDLKNEIGKKDVIFLLATEHNLKNLSWNFIELAYNEFKGINDPSLILKRKIDIEIARIRRDPVLFQKVKMSTEALIMNFDTALYYEANWQLQKK